VEERVVHQPSDGGSIPTSPTQFSRKAHQRLIREHHALEPDPLVEEKTALAASVKNARVREIDRKTAETIILKYEWLGNMGTTDYAFGLYFGKHLAGAVCFGRTAGTKTAESICGKEYSHLVKTLNRGACVHWAHPHSASFLIARACKLMTKKGFHIFVAYSDPEAGEVGTVYQACGWNHYGTVAGGSTGFRWSGKPIAKDPIWGTFKDGKIHDARNIHHSIRRGFRIECSRSEKRLRMIQEGFEFLRLPPRRRYVGFYGNEETVATLRAALKWTTFPYPKRDLRVEEDRN
jgi:hypothetical protein